MIQQLLQGQKRYMEQFHHNDTATEVTQLPSLFDRSKS